MFAGALVCMTAVTVGFCVFTWHKAIWPAAVSGTLGLGLSWTSNRKLEAARAEWEKYLKGEIA